MRICNGNKKTGNLINSEDFKGQHLRGESLKRKRSSDSCKATSDPLNCNKSKPNQLNSDKEENTTFQGNQSTKQHEEIGTYFTENLKSSVNKFHQSMQYFLIQCSLCYEAWPLITKQKSCKSDNSICHRCKIDKETPKKFSANSMIPSPLPAELQNLTQIEEMLIARALPIMRVYVKSSGQRGYSGHCINLPQNVSELAQSLPGCPRKIPVILVTMQGKDNTIKDVIVRRKWHSASH